MALTDWTPIVLGGGGLVTVMTFVTKGIVDQKQETISRYDRQCQDLKEEIKAEREKVKSLMSSIAQMLKEVDVSSLDPASAALLGGAIYKAEEPLQNLEEEFRDCEIAAAWIESCKTAWARESSSFACKRYASLVPFRKRGKFKAEIERYLDWAHIYLYKGAVGDVDISNYVSERTISSPHPYTAAIRQIIDREPWGELSLQQSTFLTEVLMRLIERINDSSLTVKSNNT